MIMIVQNKYLILTKLICQGWQIHDMRKGFVGMRKCLLLCIIKI